MTGKDIVKTDPDPTQAVKEALTLAIKNLEEKIEARFAANDKAVIVARDELTKMHDALKELIMQQFTSNKELVDKLALASKDLVDQLSKANSVALQAALSTQKESAAKSEGAIGELLKQLQLNYEAAIKGIVESQNRLTSRMDTGEGRGTASTEDRQGRVVDRGQSINIMALVIGFGGVVVAIISAYLRH